MKKADISMNMVVWAVLALIVIAIVAYFVWHEFLRGSGMYQSLQKTVTDLSWLEK